MAKKLHSTYKELILMILGFIVLFGFVVYTVILASEWTKDKYKYVPNNSGASNEIIESFEKRAEIKRLSCDHRDNFSWCSGLIEKQPVRYACSNESCQWYYPQ